MSDTERQELKRWFDARSTEMELQTALLKPDRLRASFRPVHSFPRVGLEEPDERDPRRVVEL